MPGMVKGTGERPGNKKAASTNRLLALNALRMSMPDIVENSLNYIEENFNNEDVQRRKEAHALVHKILDKMVPSKIEHETTAKNGEVDEKLAAVLLEVAKHKGIDLSDVSDAIEVEKEVEK